ncbi:MAG TPA: endonuclease/exonuclease/phosphatase family protein [Polyangiaceae bacterium]|nr:endonuclease/exonuclease/phosphatase family protein [Polyangiaceae bacterium]
MRTWFMTLALATTTVLACSESDPTAAGARDCAGGGGAAGGAGKPSGGGHSSGNGGASGNAGSGMSHGGAVPEPAQGGDAGVGGDAEGGDRGGDAGAGGDGPQTWRLRALTYNTALAPGFEPFVDERKPEVEAALLAAAHDLDLLCVQEYWDGSHFEALARGAAAELPHVLRQAPQPGTGACTEPDLGGLLECLGQNCADADGAVLVQCAQEKCAQQIIDMDGGCLGCVLGHLEHQDFGECIGEAASDPALFGGAFDIGLLSRYPILQQEALKYDAYFVRASALYAQVDVPGLGAVDTFCTHLGSSLGVIPYRGPHGSWDGEHSYQMAQLIALMARKNAGQRPLLLLGDLNTGPASAGPSPLSAELPLDYQLLLDSGLRAAVTEPQCTLCPENVLRGEGSRKLWLDHAFLRGFDAKSSSQVTLTDTFLLGSAPDQMPMSLSDHYGLSVTLSEP